MRHGVLYRALLCLIVVALAGCVAGGKRPGSTVLSTADFELFNGEYEVMPAFADHMPRSIAVLPFTGDPSTWQSVPNGFSPTDLVRRGMYNHISSLPFNDLELHDVDRRLANAGLNAGSAEIMLRTKPQELRSILGVDAVVAGQVTNFDRVFVGIVSQVAVGCDLELIDLETGKKLWRASHVSRELGGGISLNPIGLAMSAMASVWNLREEQLYRKTDDLFREIAMALESSLPESLARRSTVPPQIDFFALLSENEAFRAGDALRFRLVGDPGAEAYVDLPGFKTGIRLTPVAAAVKQSTYQKTLESLKAQMGDAGEALTPEQEQAVLQALATREVYEGTYVVEPGVDARDLLARGYLIAPNGGMAATFFNERKLVIDAKPPMAPLRPIVTALDRAVDLSWRPSPSQDTQMYVVYMAAGDAIDFTQVATTGGSSVRVSELVNFVPVRIKLVAVDEAGNESDFTKILHTEPVPDKQLSHARKAAQQLGGAITNALRLSADRSPYEVTSTLVIGKRGALYVEPGVAMQFAPNAGLVVEGGSLTIAGTADAPVQLIPAMAEAVPGAWQGVSVSNGGSVKIEHAQISKAAVGLAVQEAAPRLTGVTIRNSATAGISLKQQADVALSCVQVRQSSGMGGIVAEGQDVKLAMKHSELAGNVPFDVQNFSPLMLELSQNYWPDGAPKVLGNAVMEPMLESAPVCP